MPRSATLAFLLALGVACPAPTQDKNAADTILRADGKHLTKVEIVALGMKDITYKTGGAEKTVPTSLTTGYRFDNPPAAYARGTSAVNRGDHAAAGALFLEAAEKAERPIVKRIASVMAGRELALAARKDPSHANNAVGALERYLAEAPEGMYVPEAKVGLARCSIAKGDFAAAETLLSGLESEAATGGWPLRWTALAKFLKGEAQFEQGKFSEARSSYDSIGAVVDRALIDSSEHAVELEAIKTNAKVLQGETYIGQKSYDEALNYFRNLANTNTRGVKAAAEAGQGQILFIQGSEQKDKAKLRQAQLALAHAIVEPDTNPSTSAKALYYMGKTLAALGDAEENSRARAKSYFQSVRTSFSTTPWAAMARKELDG